VSTIHKGSTYPICNVRIAEDHNFHCP
jgi:hypothetical protein